MQAIVNSQRAAASVEKKTRTGFAILPTTKVNGTHNIVAYYENGKDVLASFMDCVNGKKPSPDMIGDSTSKYCIIEFER